MILSSLSRQFEQIGLALPIPRRATTASPPIPLVLAPTKLFLLLELPFPLVRILAPASRFLDFHVGPGACRGSVAFDVPVAARSLWVPSTVVLQKQAG